MTPHLELRRFQRGRRVQVSGATLAEFVVVVPTLLMLIMAVLQAGFAFHAKSQLNYATMEATRAGTVNNASMARMVAAFSKGMIGYYGGGTSLGQLATSAAKATADLAGNVRVEVLSPTKESFDDYNSPQLQAQLRTGGKRVIPNDNLGYITCPVDVPGCKSDPKTNASGQTLSDANLLKLRITYGIPVEKQMPLVGRFYTWVLDKMNPADADVFRRQLVTRGRIPLISHTTMRMQSAAIEDVNSSIPGPGNGGKPVDPGPPDPGLPLPSCPWWDPTCTICKDGIGSPGCEKPPSTGGGGGGDPKPCIDDGHGGCKLPPGCEAGSNSCDPNCGRTMCCLNP